MTTPDERRRNLIWGRETLEEFAQDAGLTANWRREAGELLMAYPPVEFLRAFDAGDPVELEPHAAVLFRARSLFQLVEASPASSAQRKYSLSVVLRHFY